MAGTLRVRRCHGSGRPRFRGPGAAGSPDPAPHGAPDRQGLLGPASSCPPRASWRASSASTGPRWRSAYEELVAAGLGARPRRAGDVRVGATTRPRPRRPPRAVAEARLGGALPRRSDRRRPTRAVARRAAPATRRRHDLVRGRHAGQRAVSHRGVPPGLERVIRDGGPRAAAVLPRLAATRRSASSWPATSCASAIEARAEEVLIVNGSQQGFDLVARTLIDPGDFVAIEQPSYPRAVQVFRAFGAELLPVPFSSSGPGWGGLSTPRSSGPPAADAEAPLLPARRAQPHRGHHGGVRAPADDRPRRCATGCPSSRTASTAGPSTGSGPRPRSRRSTPPGS